MKRFAILAGLPLLALATPAAAQTVTASAYKTTLEFAGCVAAANPADTKALLASTPASAQDVALTKKLAATAGCPGKPKEEALRGALAERVYLVTYPTAPAEPATTGAPAAFKGSGDAALANWDITRCVATRDPVGADMLVRSELGSQGQKDAIKRISPVIGGCVPAGMQVGFDREKMRGLIAEGLLAVRGAGTN